ncbi:MAG: Type 1 glutamine amidotransferase-like domain-containing protein [Candidatus Omnitrophica bacterium]|nr:Type 1 glutamine amidotransferase-like domain-containing protein [Candidatus Omnitrophota bacterium]
MYLFAGGGHSPSLYRSLLQKIFSGLPRPADTVAYIGAANGDNHSFFTGMAALLRAAGAGTVRHARVSGAAEREKAQSIIAAAPVIFIGGGDVEKGMERLTEAKLCDLLRQRAKDGALLCGFSAGSIMLCREWITWTDPDDDRSAARFPCLNIAPMCCDTHGEDDDWSELRALIALSPAETLGYGIPSGSAVSANPAGTLIAYGAPVACFRRTQTGVVNESPLMPRNTQTEKA